MVMYDGQLKEGLKTNQSPSEVMTAQFSEVIERIQTLHAAENKADGDVGPPENKESGPSEPPPLRRSTFLCPFGSSGLPSMWTPTTPTPRLERRWTQCWTPRAAC